MNRRVLIVEPDVTNRRMIELALGSAGYVPMAVATVEASRPILDAGNIDVVVAEVRATNAEGTDGIRALRADYPAIPLVVTGTFFTTRVLEDLVRARVDDVVPKPFTPRDLVAAVDRVSRAAKARGDGALEYAAAMAAARRAIVEGRLADAESPLRRARAVSPLDAESMALFALVRELSGDDEDAARAYRAALALAADDVTEDALPSEGIARLHAYGDGRVVADLDRQHRHVLWLVGDVRSEFALGPPGDATVDVVVFALGLVASEIGATYARLGHARAFLIATSAMTERFALRIARSFERSIVIAHPPTRARIGAAGEAPARGANGNAGA